ncbi:hypothetical protein ACHHYP_04145 [Achlya hypogyna]|uniref:Secreted protein n=1 Tax=Achlya hypogyna TaxID=1202772 RepID=A0A1V9Z212_ACHHY|nr:hypothetical protein ACHHYP_04145 [Achlya hypogyna]
MLRRVLLLAPVVAANTSAVPPPPTNVLLICSLSIGTIVLAVAALAVVLLLWKPTATIESSASFADLDAIAGCEGVDPTDFTVPEDVAERVSDDPTQTMDAAFYLVEDRREHDVAILAPQRSLA